jgi:TRAP transporter TAXI family solute receptor
LAQVISSRIPDVSATAQSGNASVANVNLVAQDEVETAFIQNNVLDSAYFGRDQWQGKPLKNLRVIASLYPETIQICALKSAKIKVVSDSKGKRVMLGDKGSGSEFDARNILNAHGITYDMIKPDYVGWEVAAQRLKDDQGDMLFQTAGYPASYIIDLTTMKDVNLVSLSDDAIQKLCGQYKFYVPSTIPAKTYRGQDQEVKSIAMMALWVTNDAMSEKLVYEMTKALWEKGNMANRKDQADGAEILAKVVPETGKFIKLKNALQGITTPLHPGAERYYKEKGMLK